MDTEMFGFERASSVEAVTRDRGVLDHSLCQLLSVNYNSNSRRQAKFINGKVICNDHRSGSIGMAQLYAFIWETFTPPEATQQFMIKSLIREVNCIENRRGTWTFYFHFWYGKV